MRRSGFLVVVLALGACAEAEGPPSHLAIPGADAERGRALIGAYGCGACHLVPGVEGANGIVAPPLENFAERTLLAGTFPNVPRFLVPWVTNPPELKPDTGMPDLGVSEAEARDIASYLYTLGRRDDGPRAQAAVTGVTGEAFEALRAAQKQRLHEPETLGIDRAMDAVVSDDGG